MRTARVLGAGRANHPSSNRNLMRIETDLPWASGGVFFPSTEIWADMTPEPQNGDQIAWDGHHDYWKGQTFPKPEYDTNPDAPLQ